MRRWLRDWPGARLHHAPRMKQLEVCPIGLAGRRGFLGLGIGDGRFNLDCRQRGCTSYGGERDRKSRRSSLTVQDRVNRFAISTPGVTLSEFSKVPTEKSNAAEAILEWKTRGVVTALPL